MTYCNKSILKPYCDNPSCALCSEKVWSDAIAQERLIERLARIEHERWGGWQQHLHNKTYLIPDTNGNRGIYHTDFKRWEKQINMPYSSLSEDEKESDRKEVRKYLVEITDTIRLKMIHYKTQSNKNLEDGNTLLAYDMDSRYVAMKHLLEDLEK